MQKNLVVVLSDRNHINQAKQVFSSVFFKAKWKGDMLLLSHNIPNNQLHWFRERHILVKAYKPITTKFIGNDPPVFLSKFNLFRVYFKKWKVIIYLDTDVIVRSPLNKLSKLKGFYAAPEENGKKLRDQFIKSEKLTSVTNNKLVKKLRKKFNFNRPSFNAGVLVFSSGIIKKDTFNRIKKLFKLYANISLFSDQTIENLFFYGSWKKLARIYNIYPEHYFVKRKLPYSKISGAILHFVGIGKNVKPWNKKNYFYKEWRFNLKRSEFINRNKVISSKSKATLFRKFLEKITKAYFSS
jgi:lipopolysaccharide biosynthesis glycosyltransferase